MKKCTKSIAVFSAVLLCALLGLFLGCKEKENSANHVEFSTPIVNSLGNEPQRNEDAAEIDESAVINQIMTENSTDEQAGQQDSNNDNLAEEIPGPDVVIETSAPSSDPKQTTSAPTVRSTPEATSIQKNTDPTTGPAQGFLEDGSDSEQTTLSSDNQGEWMPE